MVLCAFYTIFADKYNKYEEYSDCRGICHEAGGVDEQLS